MSNYIDGHKLYAANLNNDFANTVKFTQTALKATRQTFDEALARISVLEKMST